MDIAVIVPSRGRPGNIEQLAEQFRNTVTGLASLFVYVDDDDPELDGYMALTDELNISVGPRTPTRMGGTLNLAACTLAPHYDVLGFMGDDHRPRTVGWDQIMARALTDLGGLGIAYGNDLIMGPNLPTAVFMTSNIVETLGYFVPPGLIHLFMDNYWRTLGEQLGTIAYRGGCVIEHVHPLVGKAPDDDTYRLANSPETWAADEATFAAYCTNRLPDDLSLLRAVQRSLAG